MTAQAVFTNHTSLVIQASAGSGKTYQLITRMLQLLLQGAEPESILAVTFTRKAAYEMQLRLYERLQQLATLNENVLTEQLKQYTVSLDTSSLAMTRARARGLYEKVLLSPVSVRATTFHAFCQDVLKRFPFEADVPPGFSLLELTHLYKQQAWQMLMADCEKNPDAPLATAVNLLFDQLGLHSTRAVLNTFLDNRTEWWAYTQHNKHPVEAAIQHLQKKLGDNLERDLYTDFFNLQPLKQYLLQFSELLQQQVNISNQKAIDNIHAGLNASLSNKHRYQCVQAAFFTQDNKPRSRKFTPTLVKKVGTSPAETFISLHQTICELIEQHNKKLASQASYRMNKHWYIAGQQYLQHYQKLKYSMRVLDFSDLEWKTYSLLNLSNHALWVQYKLDARIDHLLIDEFQDTNPIQWRLVLPLLEEYIQQTDKPRSVLLVGDTKQSIYRFRRAESRLFATAQAYIKQNFDYQQLPLNASWRSSPVIIEFVNKLFTSEPLHTRIDNFTTHTTMLQNLSGKITLLPVFNNNDAPHPKTSSPAPRNPLQQARNLKQIDANEHEAALVAKKITELISTALPVQINDAVSPVQYKDIMVLLRNRTHAAAYENALHQAGIPFEGIERGTLLECIEVTDMITLLNWLITPFDNIALASILRSPLFSVSDDILMDIAQAATGNWIERIATLLPELESSHILHYACQQLSQWQTIANQLPVHDLLDKIYNEGNILARYEEAFPIHLKARVKTNLTRLIELALETDSGRYPSLHQFIEHLKMLTTAANEAPNEPATATHQNRVHLLTIHAAKGLEAPVIFLANTDAESSDKYTYKTLVSWPVEDHKPEMIMLAGKKESQDPLTLRYIEQDRKRQLQEDGNLLYVAITRARQYLYISAAQTTETENWFNLICRCYQLDNSLTVEQVLDSSATTPSGSEQKQPPISREPEPLPAPELLMPPPVSRSYHEIAPSLAENTSTHKPTKDKPVDADAQQRGILIHHLLELITENPGSTKHSLLTRLSTTVPSTLFETAWLEVANLISAKHLQFIFSPRQFETIFNEAPVYYNQNGTTVYGIVDRIVVTKESIILIDYKTHQYVNKKNIATISENYRMQIQLYENGLKQIWPDREMISYLLFTHPQLLFNFRSERNQT